MPQTRTSCPRCRNPLQADVQQVFDMNVDPQAKQRLLGNNVNHIRCPSCGYDGKLNVPVVYHDPEKELLLTFFPPEMGLPYNEQERLMGPLIKQVVDKLPLDKRKAYILRPQTMLTMQTMIDRVLQGEGITREMVEAQQKALALMQRLMQTPPADRAALIKREEAQIDMNFFNLLNRLLEVTSSQGDQQSAQQLVILQKELLQSTKVGQELQKQAQEAQEAVRTLQEAGKNGLTREVLLDLIINAPNEIRLNTLVSLAHTGMDYTFFQLFSEQIEKASDEAKVKLTALRDKLLEMTKDIQAAIQKQYQQVRQSLEKLISAPNIEDATRKALESISDVFVEVLQTEIQLARQNADLERGAKLAKVMAVIEEASAPPPEVAFIQDLLAIESDEELNKQLEENSQHITPEFLDMLNNVIARAEQQPPEVTAQLQKIYRSALRFSMQKNIQGKK